MTVSGARLNPRVGKSSRISIYNLLDNANTMTYSLNQGGVVMSSQITHTQSSTYTS